MTFTLSAQHAREVEDMKVLMRAANHHPIRIVVEDGAFSSETAMNDWMEIVTSITQVMAKCEPWFETAEDSSAQSETTTLCANCAGLGVFDLGDTQGMCAVCLGTGELP